MISMSTNKEAERSYIVYDHNREFRREITRNTQAINDYQEHTLQSSKEIADSYLESQKEIIKSFQSAWAPYIENMYEAFWNKWASPQRAAEIYARTVSNFADNMMATSRIANNTLFANLGAYKAFVQREKEDVKEFSRIAANTARTFESISRESVPNNRPA
jgi:phage-related tail protein